MKALVSSKKHTNSCNRHCSFSAQEESLQGLGVRRGAPLTETCLEMRTRLNQRLAQGPAASSQQLGHQNPGLCSPLLPAADSRSAREKGARESEVPTSQEKEEICGNTFPFGSQLSGLLFRYPLCEAPSPALQTPGGDDVTWPPPCLGQRTPAAGTPLCWAASWS